MTGILKSSLPAAVVIDEYYQSAEDDALKRGLTINSETVSSEGATLPARLSSVSN